jgi:serine/threonine protein kinase
MSDDRYDEILSELLEAAEGGRDIPHDELLAKHPGHAPTVRRVLADLANYKRLAPGGDHRPAPVDALQRGDRLGDFEIHEPLASGGMGIVYRALQLSLGNRRVALKLLPVASANVRDVARFQREALALAGLHHRNLVEVFGFGEERGYLFFAMRLVDGPNLRDVLERRALARTRDDAATRRRLVERIAEVADALAVVHAAGLVHRDVKPSNIVLEGSATSATAFEGSAVLVDFGLVRPIDALAATMTGDSPATPSYAPPEQLLGREIDARADVFSLGATLHDLLAARTPHARMQASVGLEAIDTLVPEVDADLAAVVGKAVDPEADWRYPDARALLDDLRAWLAGEPVSARRMSAFERARRWSARHPRAIARTALGALVVVGAVIAATGINSLVQAGYVARAARQRGDVTGVVESLRRIPSALRWPLLRDRELVELAPRAVALAPSDPIVKIRNALGAHDATTAMIETVTDLRLRGSASDALVRDYLVASLTPRMASLDSAPRDEELRRAVFLTARLLYERPAVSAEDDAFFGKLRKVLLGSMERDDVDRDTWLHVVTALSGCGRPEDIVPILDRTLAAEQLDEDQRIGMHCAERIVRRAHRCGTLARVPWTEVWTRYEPIVREGLSPSGSAMPFMRAKALHGLHTAVLFALRKLGREEELVSITRGAWRERALAELEQGRDTWLRELAAVREPRVRERLAADTFAVPVGAHQLGWLCAALGDEALTAQVRARLSGQNDSDRAREFDDGIVEGRQELDGIRPDFDLDADTLLGAPLDAHRSLDVPKVRGDDGWEYVFAIDEHAQPPHDALVRAAEPAAFWLFYMDAWTLGRAARDANCRYGEVGRETPGFLKLGIPGKSELVMTCDLPPLPEHRLWAFVLRHQMGARDYYPFAGRVEFEVALNGTSIHRALIARTDTFPTEIELPTSHLRQGTNEIRVRLTETTTATFRVFAAAVVQRDKF